jgi:hypothetical protein
MRDRAAALLLPLLLLLGFARSAAAEIAESAYSIVLTGKRTLAGPAGDRIAYVRIGTKDVIERFRDALGGISGRSIRLVVQRPIEDLGFASACEYLLIDGQYFPVGGTSERIEMPASFHGATRTSARRPGHPDLQFTQEAVGLFRMHDAFEVSGDFAFSAVLRRTARLYVDRGVALGYLHTAMLWRVSGGLGDPSGRMPVTGTLSLGPERIVTTPGGPCSP